MKRLLIVLAAIAGPALVGALAGVLLPLTIISDQVLMGLLAFILVAPWAWVILHQWYHHGGRGGP